MNNVTALEPRTLRRLSIGLLGAGALYAASPVHLPLPCPLLTVTGIPCPLCGMTRSVIALFRADFIGSVRFNPGGILLVFVAMIFSVWRPRLQLQVALWVLPVLVGALWVWNIGFNPTFT